jgi:nucleotide-binding universal stress UspA family protein
MRLGLYLLSIISAVFLTGCASTYIPPSGRADFSAFRSASLKESFAAKPAAVFPASIAVVRVQAPHYRNFFTEREGGVYGQGRYSVVTVKEVEADADLERIKQLTQVDGVATLSTLLLPQKLESDQELREAAARLKADMLLVYTLDTTYHENDASVALNLVTLGLSPTRKVFVHVTASALLMDTRTGFIYAALEANEHRQLTSNVWESGESADRARREAENTAFKSIFGEFEKSWPTIIERAHKGS